MGLFEGKTPSERNKMIAAGILGVVSLVALYMAFGRGGSSTAATTKASPSPSPKIAVSNPANKNQFDLPTPEQDTFNMIVPVVYNPGGNGAPDPGRNIFAFYEPPPPTPYQTPSPTPIPPPVIPTPTPIPPPPFDIVSVTPTTVYAGTKGTFKLEVFGDRFTPDARIYFNQTEMPTTFVSAQGLTTTITENLIPFEGPKQIIVQTPDGRLYSRAVMLNVLAPPKPSGLQYIGMIGRKRYNNDTAYFMEPGKTLPSSARLNDLVGGRFRLVDISAAEVVLEDVNLGFKHRIAMTTTPSGISGSGGSTPTGGFIPYNPSGNPQIPNPNAPRMAPQPQPQRPDQRRPPNPKDDVDDNDKPDR